MTKQEEKQRLRRVVRGLEERLSPRYLELSGQAIAARLLAMPEYQAAGTVFCFAGAGREVDTRPILENALARRKTLCLPLCTSPGQMELRQVTALEQLVPGAFGIPAPPADSPLTFIRMRSILLSCPASPATAPDAAWAAAAASTTASCPTTGAEASCCAGSG